jgi:hypothetical protein
LVVAREGGDDGADLLAGEHGGQALGFLRPDDVYRLQLDAEHLTVEREQGGEGLTSASSVQAWSRSRLPVLITVASEKWV